MKNDGEEILKALGIDTKNLLEADLKFRPMEGLTIECTYLVRYDGEDVETIVKKYEVRECPST